MPWTYIPLKLFSIYSMKLFFRDINVINEQNIPEEGPVIIYGNHNNQFVDGMSQLQMAVVKRHISFIAAAVSCRRTVIGPLLKGCGVIPVQRPQDVTEIGKGKILKIYKDTVLGEGTEFLKINPQSVLGLIEGKISGLKIKEIVSNTELILDKAPGAKDVQYEGSSAFKIIPKLDFNEMYENVWNGLNEGKCIGIFPEGGSHDNMELLPLKAGICIMALGAMQKYNKPVKLIPCGLNYYNPNKFRGKVIIEFGEAYTIPQQLLDLYRTNRKEAISILLTNLEQMLRAVTTQYKSFDKLSTLLLARELYTMNSVKELSTKEKLQINRRFAQGVKALQNEPEFKEVEEQMEKFEKFVRLNGIKVTREKYFSNIVTDFLRFFFYLEKCIVRSIIALPGLIVMGPTTSLITYWAEKERIRCKRTSKVKEQAHDVVSSYKILLSMFLFPITAAVHSTILYFVLTRYFECSHKKGLKASLISFALLPIYALIMVKSYDSFGRSFTKLKYMFWRLFKRGFYEDFNNKKKMFSRKILELIEKHGENVVGGDFQNKRILKKEDMYEANTELYIFDKEEE